jgi:hypothetical protein
MSNLDFYLAIILAGESVAIGALLRYYRKQRREILDLRECLRHWQLREPPSFSRH